jgi:hypothetical protein
VYQSDLAKEILQVSREQIKLADQKASFLLAGLTTLFGFVISNFESLTCLDPTKNKYFIFTHFVFFVVAYTALSLSVLPRNITTKVASEPPSYFGDINALSKGLTISEAASRVGSALSEETSMEIAITYQLISVARIVRVKFKLIQTAIFSSSISILTILILLVIKAL